MFRRSLQPTLMVLGLTLLLLPGNGWAQIFSWGVQIDGQVGATCCNNQTNLSQAVDTGQLPQSSYSTNIQVTAVGAGCGGQQSGFGQTGGTASLGVLHATASANATDASGGVCGTGIDDGTGQAVFYDTLQITSDTLPVGTPVGFRVTLVLFSSVSVTGRPIDPDHGTAIASVQVYVQGGLLPSITNNASNPIPALATNATFSANVGDFVTVKGILNVQATVDTSPTYSSVAANCDANQGAFFYIDPVANGVSYTTSGQSYLTPPPNQLAIQYGKTGATLGFSTILDDLYDVQSRDDLVQGAWSTMASNLVGTGGTLPFTDLTATNAPKRFYRVKVHF